MPRSISAVMIAWLAALAGCKDANEPAPARRSGDIVFQSNRTGDFDIYVMRSDGSDVRRLTDSPYHDIHPAWSPDGMSIAFVSHRPPSGVYIMNADGSNVRRLLHDSTQATYPAWSPDGKRLAYQVVSRIWIAGADGSDRRQLTPESVSAGAPTWSPDGKRIAFELDVHSIGVINTDGTGLRELVPRPTDAFDATPAWSPDGKRLAFHRLVIMPESAHQSIWVVNADGTNQVRLTHWNAGADFTPAWSQDGDRIAFAHALNDNYDIYVMNADGSAPANISRHPGINFRPSW